MHNVVEKVYSHDLMTGLTVWWWLIATSGHFVLVSRFLRRVVPADTSLDEQACATILGGIGTLSVVLHLVAFTTGLSLIHGSLALVG